MILGKKLQIAKRFATLLACGTLLTGVLMLLIPALGWAASDSGWRLKKDMLAAGSNESLIKGLQVLGLMAGPDLSAESVGCLCGPLLQAVMLQRLAFWGQLTVLDKDTTVSALQHGTFSRVPGATKVKVLQGAHAGQVWWLYPQSAENLGFFRPKECSRSLLCAPKMTRR